MLLRWSTVLEMTFSLNWKVTRNARFPARVRSFSSRIFAPGYFSLRLSFAWILKPSSMVGLDVKRWVIRNSAGVLSSPGCV